MQSLTKFTVPSRHTGGGTSSGYVLSEEAHSTVAAAIVPRQTSGAAGAEITIAYALRAICVRVKVGGQTCLTECFWVPSW